MIVTPELMQRVEDAIAAERCAFADGMAALQPAGGATWLAVAGGRAIFTGNGFFANRAMALGIHEPVSPEEVNRVEAFYTERGVPSEIEIASTVERPLLHLLNQRGYRLVRFRNIYAQTLLPHDADDPGPRVRAAVAELHEVDDSNATAWSTTLLDGFEYTVAADRDRVAIWNRMIHSLPQVTSLIAVIDDKPVGAGSVILLGATAVLGGAATLPAFRRRGIQRMLIEARLAIAARAGCSLAIVTADPGGTSGRNAERTGFQLVCNHLGMRAP
jgi:GNAT superfamily N-acetyltransferase